MYTPKRDEHPHFFHMRSSPPPPGTKFHIPHPFSNLAYKIHTGFQTGKRSQNTTYMFIKHKLYHHYEIRSPTRRFLKILFEIGILWAYFLFIWNQSSNLLLHHCGSLKNYTQFQTRMGKVYTLFRPKRCKKPYPLGRHIPIWLI